MKNQRSSIDGFVPRQRGQLGENHKAVSKPSTKKGTSGPQRRAGLASGATAKTTVSSRPETTIGGNAHTEDISESLKGIDAGDQPKHKKKKHSRRRKIIKRVIILLVVLVLAIGAFLGIRALMALYRSTDGNLLGLVQREPLREDENGRSNFVIFGTAEDSEGGQHEGGNLTDSIMLLSINQTTKDAYMVSVPRDLWVRYEEPCSAVGYEGKINAVYYCASNDGQDEQAGANALKDQVGEFFGIETHYYTHLNFGVVEDAVDAVGGVTVTIESDDPRGILDRNFDWKCNYECYYVNYDNGEEVHLDGEHALALARARNAQGGYGLSGGNFDREHNQQKIMVALRDQALSAGTLTNINSLTRLIDAFGDNLRTNVQTNELQTLVGLANDVDNDNIRSLSLVDEEEMLVDVDQYMGQSIVRPVAGIYDYSQIHQFIQRNSSRDPVVREGAPIVVLNGTGQPGVAAGEASALEEQGFNISITDDAPAGEYADIEVYRVSSDEYGETASALRRHYGLENLRSETPPVAVAEGTGFVIVVGRVPEVVQ